MRNFWALLLRFIPTTATLRGLGQLIWLLTQGGWRALVWGDVSDGMVNLRGASSSLRTLVRVAFLLVLALLISLLFNDFWRAISPLVPASYLSNSPAPALAPRVLIPITLGLMALAWAYMLAGALHSPWWLRLGLLAVFVVDSFFGLTFGSVAGIGLLALLLQLAALGVLVLFVLLRWRRSPRPGLEFPVVLICVATVAIGNYLRAWRVEVDYNTTQSWTATLVGSQTQFVNAFLLPFFLIAGMEVAGVAVDVTGLVGSAVQRLSWPLRWIALLLAMGLALRLGRMWGGPLLAGEQLPVAAGAWLIVGLLALLTWAARPRLTVEPLPEWAPVVSAFLMLAAVMLVTAVLGIAGGVLLWFVGLGGSLTNYNQGLATLDRLIDAVTNSNEYVVGPLALLWGLWLVARASRRRINAGEQRQAGLRIPQLALYAWMFGLWLVWWRLTRVSGPLGQWRFAYGDVDVVLTTAAFVALLALGATRRLTPARLWWLVTAGLLAVLLAVQDFLADPLSPLFGLLGAQALLISVGVFLGLMAAGKRFQLNESSPAVPRSNRILLYFGYALFSVTVTNWLWATHQTGQLDLIDLTTQNGFNVIGLPFVLLLLFVAGQEILVGEEGE